MGLLSRLHQAGGYESTIVALLENTKDLPPIYLHKEQEEYFRRYGIEILLSFRLSPIIQAIRTEHFHQQKLMGKCPLNTVEGKESIDIIHSRLRFLGQITHFMLGQYRVQYPQLKGIQDEMMRKTGKVGGCIFDNWQMTYFAEKKLIQKQ